ncbi:hypothetical protein BDU57DRAFT_570094 [Ampelomyces quisqualis]|uniref:Uncharacterized protein n=1 Tax=Ampelomyces quisqualis TaxID=50730 RepID=A0A6A5QZF5_AMPQU|nr:hypothetical protein BDU57DRAFT_570094 [Ampelomyces quisqualis]
MSRCTLNNSVHKARNSTSKVLLIVQHEITEVMVLPHRSARFLDPKYRYKASSISDDDTSEDDTSGEESSEDDTSGEESSEDDTSGEERSEDERLEANATDFYTTQSKSEVQPNLRVYTYQDLEALLLNECHDHFSALPSIDTISFDPCPASRLNLTLIPTSDKRILFGRVDSAIPENRDQVYLYIGGKGNNRTCLGDEMSTEPWLNGGASLVSPTKPFWYLFSHGRAFYKVDAQRLRALTCFLFLSAGHVQTVRHYPDFTKHLVDAIAWYGRGRIVEARETSKAKKHKDLPVVLGMNSNEAKPKLTRRLSTDAEAETPSKRNKFRIEDAASQMQQCHKQLGEYITVYERESAELKSNAAQSEQHQEEIAKKVEKTKELERRLERKDEECQSAKAEATKEKAQCQEEGIKRHAAETKLTEYIDAQRKMMGMYNECGN